MPRPDHVAMAALEWERKATYRYVCDYIRPLMRSLGIPFTFVSRKKYATVGLFGGAEGESPLPPMYTNQSGADAKMPEFCSVEWKRRVVMRWAAEQPGWKERGVDCWLGMSWDEQQRVRPSPTLWYQSAYPLVYVRPTRVSGCLAAVERMGWPEPPRSRCSHCPNQADAEWAELSAKEMEDAARVEDRIRSVDPHAFLHKSMVPLRMVKFDPADDNGGLFGGCTSGMCH